MAHEIESMAYNQAEAPWHGLGNKIDDAVTTKEMLVSAGLDWRVDLAPVQYRSRRGGVNRQSTSERHHVLYRDDTFDILDIVGSRYVPFQNEEVLEFFHEYVTAGEMRLETAGSLREGRIIWALAKMDEAFEVLVPDDKVEGYVLLVNPHQYGKSALTMFTGVRVVCMNTLAMATGTAADRVKLRHTRKFDADVRENAKHRLGIARDQLNAYRADAELLASITISDEAALREIARVMRGDPSRPTPKFQNRRTNRVFDLFKTHGMGSQFESARGTAWGVLNAVTQYHDHEYGRSRDSRLSHAWLGGGRRIKHTTMRNLLALSN